MATGNLLSALQLIRRTGRITRKELARGLGLGASMTSKIVSELFEQRLICEVGRSEPESGRPSDLIALNPEAGYAVGLDISGTHQKVVVVNLCGEVVGSLSESEPIPADQQAVLQRESPLRDLSGVGDAQQEPKRRQERLDEQRATLPIHLRPQGVEGEVIEQFKDCDGEKGRGKAAERSAASLQQHDAQHGYQQQHD